MTACLPQIIVAATIDPAPDLPAEYTGIVNAEWLDTVVRQGLAQVLPGSSAGQVSLLLTDDATIQELNRQYRGLDQTTDVLSFSAEHGGHWEGDDVSPAAGGSYPADFTLPDGEPPPLGDIVISLPQAVRQAADQGMPLPQELALLLVHGALHLLGHDHLDDAPRAEMQRLERAALACILGGAAGA